MSEDRISARREFDLGFSFVCFGVEVAVSADEPALLKKAKGLVHRAFGGRAKIIEIRSTENEHSFGLVRESGLYRLYKNGREQSSGPSERLFFKFLNSMLRLEVAEFAKRKVFVHAGVVGWRGKAIVLPGKSFAGKSTLTAELIKIGAQYYSDEYAVLNEAGCVEPFPRHLSLRYFGATREREVPPEELGAEVGMDPIPVGMVLLTSYSKGAEWKPERLTSGAGIMELIPNTLTIHRDPAFALKVLDLVVRRAIIVESPRGDVKKFAKFLLAFFDKHCKLAKIA